MGIGARDAWQLARQAFADWREDGAPRLGAALAYYTLFSLAPLLLAAIAIAGLAFGEEAARGRIVAELEALVGRAGAEAVQQLVASSRRPEAGIFATIVALGTLLLGASGVFVELKNALNVIWEVKAPASGLAAAVRTRLAAFGLVVAVGFLLLVSLVVSAALSAVGRTLAGGAEPAAMLQALNTVASRGHHCALRHALQVPARRGHRVAGRLGRSADDLGPLQRGKVPDRPLPRAEQRELHLRRRRLRGDPDGLDLLRRADLLLRGGADAGLRPTEGAVILNTSTVGVIAEATRCGRAASGCRRGW